MSKKIKIEASSGNVFLDLGFGEAEAENLRLRSLLMIRITKMVRDSKWTQSDAAEVFGITQPRLNQ